MTRKRPNRKPSGKGGGQLNFFSHHASKFNIVLLSACLLILLFILFTMIRTLSYDRVYDGMYLNKASVSHMTKEELHNYIYEKYGKPIDNIVIEIHAGSYSTQLQAKDLEINFDKDKIVEAVYNHGHSGNIFQRLSDISQLKSEGKNIDVFQEDESDVPLVTYNEKVVEDLATRLIQEAQKTPVEHAVNIQEDKVTITAGSAGYQFDFETVKSAILDSINKLESNSLNILELAVKTPPKALDLNATYSQVNKSPVDAQWITKNKQKTLEKKAGQYGFSIEKSALEEVFAKLADREGETFEIPVTKIAPKITSADLVMPTFDEVLGEGQTSFSTGSSAANRNTNLKIAAKALDGFILLPGETFSFNGYIGDTTASKGYKPAPGYAGGRVTSTYGGGICQISTTLYNAVIYAVNVEVKERSNHSSTVGYVKPGFDCMINYGTDDFKFKNETGYPIKIQGIYAPGKLTFRLLGKNAAPNVKYKYEVSLVSGSVVPYKTEYTTDPARVNKTGLNGARYTMKRITYKDGVAVKTEKFFSSNYRAMHKVLLQTASTPSPSATVTPSPTPSATPNTDPSPTNTPDTGTP